jgi:hypothetical protein
VITGGYKVTADNDLAIAWRLVQRHVERLEALVRSKRPADPRLAFDPRSPGDFHAHVSLHVPECGPGLFCVPIFLVLCALVTGLQVSGHTLGCHISIWESIAGSPGRAGMHNVIGAGGAAASPCLLMDVCMAPDPDDAACLGVAGQLREDTSTFMFCSVDGFVTRVGEYGQPVINVAKNQGVRTLVVSRLDANMLREAAEAAGVALKAVNRAEDLIDEDLFELEGQQAR